MTAVDTTTTTTTSTSTQQGTQLVVSSQANTQSVGNFVTDVSIAPYINPVIISFFAYNMRPNQLVHVFFDSVLVDQYCAPGIVPTSAIADTSNYESIQVNGTWGTPIYTNAVGQVAGQFNIPGATFKTGDRVLEIADVNSLTLGEGAITTKSTATFTASNLNVTKSAVTLTTVNPVLSTMPVTNTVVTTTVSTSNTTLPDLINVVNNVVTNTQVVMAANVIFDPYIGFTDDGYDPLAQGFTVITPQNQSGVYVTSLDLFFEQKSQIANNGVTVYLCQVDNGYPNTSCVLPFSTTHLNFANIAVSNDSTVSTNFKFESPVFLNNNTQYAFVVKPDASDPDYDVYTANIGDIDIATGYQVFSQPIVGTAYYGASQSTWTALQTEYIKFNLRRATFMAAQGDAFFYNANSDYVFISGLTFSNTSAALMPGDYIYQAANSNPTSANTSRSGKFNFFDPVRDIIYIENSSGNFSNGAALIQFHRFANASVATPNTSTLVAYANTLSLYNPVVDAYVPQMAQITPSGTQIVYSYKGTSNTYVVDSFEQNVTPGNDTEFFDQERIVASLSNEVSQMGSAKSFGLHASLSTTSSYVSPLIDLVRNQQLVIANEIDPIDFNYNEFYNFSETKSKYVSQIVTLASGQDAEDIQISLTAHRPPGTDISVWIKFLNGQDADPITVKTWTPLINQGASLYSDPSNPNDFEEFNFVTAANFSVFNTSGTITCNSSSANVVGVGTKFGTDVQVGWWINMAPNSSFSDVSRQILSITNTTVMTLNAPFLAPGGYAANAYYLVVPPTVAYNSTNTYTVITGNVTTSTTNNAIVGNGTVFQAAFGPGTVINVANDEQVVVSVVNSTYLTVGEPWSSNNSGANAYSVTPTGITYLNSNAALYNTFKQFQIKIVLQSNDSARVPILDDLRCLALQL